MVNQHCLVLFSPHVLFLNGPFKECRLAWIWVFPCLSFPSITLHHLVAFIYCFYLSILPLSGKNITAIFPLSLFCSSIYFSSLYSFSEMLWLGGGEFDHIMRYLKEIFFMKLVTMFNEYTPMTSFNIKKSLIKSFIESGIEVPQFFCLPLSWILRDFWRCTDRDRCRRCKSPFPPSHPKVQPNRSPSMALSGLW